MEKSSLEADAKQFDLDETFAEYAKPWSADNLSFYEIESQILALYDQLIELRLEKAILDTQLDLPQGAR